MTKCPLNEDLYYSRAVVITGGPVSVNDESVSQYDAEIFRIGLPIFGICYGMQVSTIVFHNQPMGTVALHQ